MTDLVGKRIGNYRLIRLLGKGSFADVYVGEHIYLDRQAALKILRGTVANEEDLKTFHKEAQIVAHLEHPSIVRVLEFGVDQDIPYLVMDFASGGTLRQRHPVGSQLPLTTIVPYIKQAAEALQFAHNKHFIHRDIKPENLLLRSPDELLLSDFGVALVVQSITISSHHQSEQQMAGTIAYMAPEQIQGKPCVASDQYSLGIIVYEWLSGSRPFYGSFAELIAQHMYAPPPSLLAKMPWLSPAVEQVVMTALAKDPHERFESVQTFASALEEACQESLLSSPPGIQFPALPPSSIKPPPEQIAPADDPHPQAGVPAPLQSKTRHEHTLSRRTLLYLGIGSAIVAGSGVTALVGILRNSSAHPTLTSTSTPTSTAGTPVPVGTLLLTYSHHQQAVRAIAWSPNGVRIASGSDDTTVQVWNTASGKNPFTYSQHKQAVWAVAWSPDGTRIASGSDDTTVQVWNAADGTLIYTYRGHNQRVDGVAWSPGGQYIASASRDNTVQVWNAADGSPVRTFMGHTAPVYALAWSPDSTYIASASADNTVKVWKAVTGILKYPPLHHVFGVRSVAWSPDGKLIVSGSQDSTAQVWNASNGHPNTTYPGHRKTVNGLAWSHDSKRVASGSEDMTIQLWNTADGSLIHKYSGHSASVVAVAWSPVRLDNRIASASEDKTVKVWMAE